MDTRNELLGAFDTGVVTALREMAGVEAVRRGPADATGDVVVAVWLAVGEEWRAVLAFPHATAAALARRVLAEVPGELDDEMIRDCAAEVLNVAAGQAKTLLYGTPHHFRFATPTAPPAGWVGAGVGFDSECGAFSLRVYPAAAGAATTSGA